MKLFYSPAYSAVGIRFNTFKKAGWIAASLRQHPIPGVELVAPEPATAAILERMHSAAYVRAVETGQPIDLARSNGLGWDDHLWASVTASTGGTIQAALTALATGQTAGSLSSGLHHARRDRGGLFCTFEGLTLAADAAIRAGAKRVLILDLDAHGGGGTHELIGRRSDIIHVDVSTSSLDNYVPKAPSVMAHEPDATKYLGTIQGALNGLNGTFDLVIYNSGMDPFDGGAFTPELLAFAAAREALVFAWAKAHGVPIAFVLAGGYREAREVVALHRLTVAAAARANSDTTLTVDRIRDLAE